MPARHASGPGKRPTVLADGQIRVPRRPRGRGGTHARPAPRDGVRRPGLGTARDAACPTTGPFRVIGPWAANVARWAARGNRPGQDRLPAPAR
ncbi:MAG: hypothetical protein KatS3mg114_0903 [Planctomycetaceae bacterium]|nr:MAG: hypothetical protein KatS3mg114_0903 [Planctomycetaceae bacterium]